jgi:betaine reductase
MVVRFSSIEMIFKAVNSKGRKSETTLNDQKFVQCYLNCAVLLVSDLVRISHFVTKPISGGPMLKGKKVIAIGERDGVPGPVIAECLQGAGYEVIFQATECFV